MYTGYIIHKDKAELVEDHGNITEVDNVDNLRDIVILENALENYNEDYSEIMSIKSHLVNNTKNKKANAISCFTIGAASPLMSYGLGRFMALKDISNVSVPFGCMIGTVLVGFGLGEILSIPKKSKIKKLDVNLESLELITSSLEDVIKLEKEKSKKITGPYKVIDNLVDDDRLDNLLECYEEYKDDLTVEYDTNKKISSFGDNLYNKVFTKIMEKGLTK